MKDRINRCYRLVIRLVTVSLLATSLFATAPVTYAQDTTSGGGWTLEYDLPGDGGQETGVNEEGTAARLSADGIEYSVVPRAAGGSVARLSGVGLEKLRNTLWIGLKDQFNLLRGGTEIELTGRARSRLTLVLESNPSSGYTWQWGSPEDSLYTISGKTDLVCNSNLDGAPCQQTFRLKANSGGREAVRLVYARPWDAAEPPAARLSLALDTIPAKIDLSNPEPIRTDEQTLPKLNTSNKSQTGGVPDNPDTAYLPASFDWSTTNNWLNAATIPPIRDQGYCGSCWAFSAVGTMEGAAMVQGGATLPAEGFSEAYLIACDNPSYGGYSDGCNGGSSINAQVFHGTPSQFPYYGSYWVEDPTNSGQYGAGEDTFVYADYATMSSTPSCIDNGPYNHTNYIADNWVVNGTGKKLATPEQIKYAIYHYGPVSASICVGNGFQAYTGGLFKTNEKRYCRSSGSNHAILLVGWDDATRSWRLKNSWGSGWGESGYMQIRWGVSNVGIRANYVVYDNYENYGVGTYSDDDDGIAYTGPWTNKYKVQAADGQYRLGSTKQAYAIFSFTGRRLSLLFTQGSGTAMIYIDNVPYRVRQKASGLPKYQRYWTITGLSDTQHLVYIVPNGKTKIYFDGFKVYDDATPVTAGTYDDQETDHITYTGSWTPVANAVATNGTTMSTVVKNDTAVLYFNGTSSIEVAYQAIKGAGKLLMRVERVSGSTLIQEIVVNQKKARGKIWSVVGRSTTIALPGNDDYKLILTNMANKRVDIDSIIIN